MPSLRDTQQCAEPVAIATASNAVPERRHATRTRETADGRPEFAEGIGRVPAARVSAPIGLSGYGRDLNRPDRLADPVIRVRARAEASAAVARRAILVLVDELGVVSNRFDERVRELLPPATRHVHYVRLPLGCG